MLEWPSPIRSASTVPEPRPRSSRYAASGSRTISGASSCSAASACVSTISSAGKAAESLQAGAPPRDRLRPAAARSGLHRAVDLPDAHLGRRKALRAGVRRDLLLGKLLEGLRRVPDVDDAESAVASLARDVEAGVLGRLPTVGEPHPLEHPLVGVVGAAREVHQYSYSHLGSFGLRVGRTFARWGPLVQRDLNPPASGAYEYTHAEESLAVRVGARGGRGTGRDGTRCRSVRDRRGDD